ncbi:MAG: cell envelope biogenesis protein TolA [Variovorax sp.]|nr:MAG: cell envelope biogenesis protein TolA [Variovorax sp.]
MSKVLAVMIAGLFAAGAFAQPKSSEVDPTAQGKPGAAAEAKKDARPAGQVKAPGGDQSKVSEGSGGVTATGADKGAQARRDTRDARRPDKKTGGKKAVPVQGGTPQ